MTNIPEELHILKDDLNDQNMTFYMSDFRTVKYVLASNVIQKPKYDIGDEVIAMTHSGHMFTGTIRQISTHYYNDKEYHIHMYRIVKNNQKRGINVGEKNIKGLKNDHN